MYSYEWDLETGGYILTNTQSKFSKEPRPVYYQELDLYGFDKYWNYDKEDEFPYMWAEANNYIYKGVKVAQLKGGSLYTSPQIVIVEEVVEKLEFIDIPQMVIKNEDIMKSLVNQTIQKIYDTYIEYKNKIDLFYVAFSGGKDSIVLLDVIQRALPHDDFKVVFGDTGMEFSDTYEIIKKVEDYCKTESIDFLTARSHISPLDSWRMFGAPGQTLRWCCNVHKTTPQIIELRKYLNKEDFKGMAFIGVRSDESASRSNYDYLSIGKKHKGQYSCNPILKWNSAELFLYFYKHDLIMNPAYKKGNSRVGCLVCPMATFKNEFVKMSNYEKEVTPYFDIIKECNGKDFTNEKDIKEYLETGGWKARRNGRELNFTEIKYNETIDKEEIILTITNPQTSWKIWIKTIGQLVETSKGYYIIHKGNKYFFKFKEIENGYEIKITDEIIRKAPTFSKLFKQVFRKAAVCVKCNECIVDCKYGYMKFENNDVVISDKCISCSECHKVDKGCLVYKSIELPKGGFLMSKKVSLNSYSNHGPKIEWIKSFLEHKNDFKTEHTLGKNMYDFFKRFLRDAELLEKDNVTDLANLIDDIGITDNATWGILLSNLAYTPQLNWYIKNIEFDTEYSRDAIVTMLENSNVKEAAAKQMVLAYKRILDLPFGDIGLGKCTLKSGKVVSITRTSWNDPDSRVILYSLYKFAENCGNYKQFTLTRLMNFDIESDGVSPAQIFGISRSEFETILNGLSTNYSDFIHASFTLDLDNITLRDDKTSQDVLKLLEEGN